MDKEQIEKAKSHWDAQVNIAVKRSWWQSKTINNHVNRIISGKEGVNFLAHVKELGYKNLGNGLSLGAGSGELDREIVEMGICNQLDAIDFSEKRIELCRNLAREEDLNIDYICANMEKYSFEENKYDIVFGKGVLHHIEDLEGLFKKISKALKDDGIFVVDDFFGPTRFQWTKTQIEHMERILSILPDKYTKDLIDGKLRKTIPVPSIESMIAADPTEAIRSSDLLGVIRSSFTVEEFKPYGGTIYHQLFNRIMGNFDEDDAFDVALIQMILEYEKTLIENDVLHSDYIFLIAKNKKEVSFLAKISKYFINDDK